MPLDSDINNGDSQLHVEFYESQRKEDIDRNQTVFVRIMTPGDKTNIIDQPARDHHKQRFVRQWLFFQSKNSPEQAIGTPLALWHSERPQEVTDGQMMELQILKFQTVEQVAMASDGQIQRIGMGASGLREKAKMYLASRNGMAAQQKLQETEDKLVKLQEQMAALMAGMSTPMPVETQAPKRRGPKPGFKRKDKVNADNDASVGAAGHQ